MKTTNFFALLYSFSLLLFAVLWQKTSSNSTEDQGGKPGISTQRKLQIENYIIVKYIENYNFKNGFNPKEKIKFIKCGDDGNEISADEEFTIAKSTPMYIHFSEPLQSLDFFSQVLYHYIQ